MAFSLKYLRAKQLYDAQYAPPQPQPVPAEPEPEAAKTREHEPEEVVENTDPLRCDVCGKRMPSVAALHGHMKKHG